MRALAVARRSGDACPEPRREQRKQARRAAIVEVAGRSFLKHGYGGTTMSSIAAEIGGSKGTLWNYFSSKEELFTAFVGQATKKGQAALEDALRQDLDLRSALTLFVQRYLAFICDPDAVAFQRLIIGECGRFPEIARISFEIAPARTEEMLVRYFGMQAELGVIRRDDVSLAAKTLIGRSMGGLHQRALWNLSRPSGQDLARETKHVVALFLRCFAVQ